MTYHYDEVTGTPIRGKVHITDDRGKTTICGKRLPEWHGREWGDAVECKVCKKLQTRRAA